MALTDGLLGYWKLDEDGNVPREDFFGAGPDLTPTGSPTSGEGKIGDATFFGGANAIFATNDAFSLRPEEADPDLGFSRTYAFWVKASTWNSQPGLFSNWQNAGGGSPVQFLVYADDATHITFQVRNEAGSDSIARVSAPSLDEWHLIVLTYNASTGVLGISIDNGAFTTNTVTSVAFGDGIGVVGNRNGTGSGVVGGIDALGAWSRVLTSEEIDLLWNDGDGLEPPFETAPVADFSADLTSGNAPLTVEFTDESTNDPTSWEWDFGDGGTSTEQNPTHIYTSAGIYTVTLTAANDAGSDEEEKTGYVTVEVVEDDLFYVPEESSLYQ